MKFAHFLITILLLPVIFMVGCGDSNVSGDRILLAFDNGTGHYVKKEVTLKYVTDLAHMQDKAVTVNYGGTLHVEAQPNGQNMRAYFEKGRAPNAQFIKSSGVLIPQDYDTRIMATILFSYEQLKDFYESLGATSKMTFPQTVYAQAKIMDGAGKVSGDNAAYISTFDAFIFWLFDLPSMYPIPLNTGIIAHEYFHSVFTSLTPKTTLMQNKPDTSADLLEMWRVAADPRIVADGNYFSDLCQGKSNLHLVNSGALVASNFYIFSAINEGMADYFGYLYSTNPGWIAASLDGQIPRDLRHENILNCSVEEQGAWIYGAAQNLLRLKDRRIRPMERDVLPDIHMYGSIWSHFLYSVDIGRKNQGLPASTPKQVLEFAKKIDDLFSNTSPTKIISLGDLAQIFIESGDIDFAVCESVRKVFPQSKSAIHEACFKGGVL